MQIYIMRHGEASMQCFTATSSDALRPLTELGALEAKKMGHWLAGTTGASIDIFVSPYLRAQQTCAHVVSSLSESGLPLAIQPQTLDFITPAGDVKQTHDFIDGILAQPLESDKNILLVSHMPLVSYLVAQLTQSQNMPIFATGAIAHINYDSQLMRGELLSMVAPDNV